MRNKLIAKIHMLKKEVGLDTDTYRLVLYKITKKDSCKDLDISELKEVIKELANLANQGKIKSQSKSQFSFVRTKCSLMKKIFKLWQELGNLNALEDSSNKGLNGFLLKKYQVTYHDLNRVYEHHEIKTMAIEALKAWLLRETKKRAS